MKMETAITTPAAGRVTKILVTLGKTVEASPGRPGVCRKLNGQIPLHDVIREGVDGAGTRPPAPPDP